MSINNIAAFCNPVTALSSGISNLTRPSEGGKIEKLFQKLSDTRALISVTIRVWRMTRVIEGRAEPTGDFRITAAELRAMRRLYRSSQE